MPIADDQNREFHSLVYRREGLGVESCDRLAGAAWTRVARTGPQGLSVFTTFG